MPSDGVPKAEQRAAKLAAQREGISVEYMAFRGCKERVLKSYEVKQ